MSIDVSGHQRSQWAWAFAMTELERLSKRLQHRATKRTTSLMPIAKEGDQCVYRNPRPLDFFSHEQLRRDLDKLCGAEFMALFMGRVLSR